MKASTYTKTFNVKNQDYAIELRNVWFDRDKVGAIEEGEPVVIDGVEVPVYCVWMNGGYMLEILGNQEELFQQINLPWLSN